MSWHWVAQAELTQNSEWTFVLMASQGAVRLALGEELERDVAVQSCRHIDPGLPSPYTGHTQA